MSVDEYLDLAKHDFTSNDTADEVLETMYPFITSILMIYVGQQLAVL